MSSRRPSGEAKKVPSRGSRAALVGAGILLVLLAGWWFYRAQETVARASEQTAARHSLATQVASPSVTRAVDEQSSHVRPAQGVDRAALLRAIAQHRESSPVAGVPEGARAAAVLGRDYVARGIRSAIPLLTECYDALLEHRPDAMGTVQISATIDAEPEIGAVVTESEVSGREELANDAEFTRCLRETMRTIELEPPDRAGRATFSFPLRFGAQPSSDAGSP